MNANTERMVPLSVLVDARNALGNVWNSKSYEPIPAVLMLEVMSARRALGACIDKLIAELQVGVAV